MPFITLQVKSVICVTSKTATSQKPTFIFVYKKASIWLLLKSRTWYKIRYRELFTVESVNYVITLLIINITHTIIALIKSVLLSKINLQNTGVKDEKQ